MIPFRGLKKDALQNFTGRSPSCHVFAQVTTSTYRIYEDVVYFATKCLLEMSQRTQDM